jgi:diguanylate cyclase (GGDEF)-like protein
MPDMPLKPGINNPVFCALAVLFAAVAVALMAGHGIISSAMSGRPLMAVLLTVAAVIAIIGLAVAIYSGRFAADTIKAVDRLTDGDYSARIEGAPRWLRGVPEAFERLAVSMSEHSRHADETTTETAVLMQKSAGLEEKLTTMDTELSRKETLLREVNRELVDANRSKADFISRMGRELRLPLNTIIGLADFLAQERLGALNEKQKEYIGKIRARADSLLDMENNIIEYSMLDSVEPLAYREVNTDDIASEVAGSLETYASSRGVSIGLNVPRLRLSADHNKLRHILYDLLHNAVKFNLPGGSARLSARSIAADDVRGVLGRFGVECPVDGTRSYIEFVVEDTGIGIPQSAYAGLFKPFSQASGETGAEPGGAGLSLYLVRRFVEQHGGCVWAEPVGPKGSRFHVVLPGEPCEGAAVCRKKKKVMLVEDDPDQMNLISLFLSGEPYELFKAPDGLEAIKLLDEITPDIILMDVMMPGMGGIEVCRTVKRQDKFRGLHRVPVVLMTSFTDMENKLNAIKAGADDVIFKPVDRRLLIERVKYLLEAKEELEGVMESYKDLEKEALIDPLTGLFNRRYMDDAIAREFLNSKRYGRNLSVLMLDLDHFKAYNDMYGHLAGDEVLKDAASLFVDSVREVDIIARYGGEEFMVILPETPPDLAHVVAERIRSSVAANSPVTLSIGLASFPEDASELNELINNADAALYRAKESGRNLTVTYGDCRQSDECA